MGEPKNPALLEAFSRLQEEVARERYPVLVKEPHGLFRAMMCALIDESDRKEVMRRLKEWENNNV